MKARLGKDERLFGLAWHGLANGYSHPATQDQVSQYTDNILI